MKSNPKKTAESIVFRSKHTVARIVALVEVQAWYFGNIEWNLGLTRPSIEKLRIKTPKCLQKGISFPHQQSQSTLIYSPSYLFDHPPKTTPTSQNVLQSDDRSCFHRGCRQRPPISTHLRASRSRYKNIILPKNHPIDFHPLLPFIYITHIKCLKTPHFLETNSG